MKLRFYISIFLFMMQFELSAQFYLGLFSSLNFRQKIESSNQSFKHVNYSGVNSTTGLCLGYNIKRANFDLSFFSATSNTKEYVYYNMTNGLGYRNTDLLYTKYTKTKYWSVNPNVGYSFWTRKHMVKIRYNFGANIILTQGPYLVYNGNRYNCKRITDSSGEIQYFKYILLQNTALTNNVALDYKINNITWGLNLGLNYKFNFLNSVPNRFIKPGSRSAMYHLIEGNVWQFNIGIGMRYHFDLRNKRSSKK